MIVIYTQEKTYIEENADKAKTILLSEYGPKIGQEAYSIVKSGKIGTSFRKYGGPLVKVVSEIEAKDIKLNEADIGMM